MKLMMIAKLKIMLILLILLLLYGDSLPAQSQNGEKKPHPKAVELVIQGSVYDLKGEYDKALNSYNEALIYDPSAPSICYAIAKDYIMLGKIETAMQMLERGIGIDPNYIENRKLLAALHHRKGEIDLALKQYNEVIKLDSADTDARLNLAAIYIAKKEPEKAIAQYQKLVDWGVAGREVRFELGNLYFQQEQYKEALRVFRNYIRDNAEDEQGYLAVGAVLLAQDTTEAITWYRKTYEENREFKAVLDELSSTLEMTERWDDAVELYKHELQNDSTDIFGHLRLGEIYLNKGDTTAAVQTYTKITRMHPDDWRAYFALGQINFGRQDFGTSIENFKKTLEASENIPPGVRTEAWWRLGVLYQQQQDLESAEQSYRKAQALQPGHPFTNFQLGQILFQKQQFEQAIPFLQKAIEQDPENAIFLGTLAATYDELNKHNESEEFYERALKIEPENPTILNNYSYSLTERNERLEDALTMVEKALESDPDNGAFLDTIGWVHFQMGDYEKALEYIKRSVETRDSSAEVLEHLGDVYEKLGKMDLAIEYWQKAKELDPDRESVVLKLKDN